MSADTIEIAPAVAAQQTARRKRLAVAWRQSDFLIGVAAVMAFLAFWELAVDIGWANPLFVSSPTRIVRAAIALTADGTLPADLATSGYEFLLGYGVAVVVGIPLGMLMGWYRVFNAVVEPFVNGLYPTPRIALLPLLLIWFGIGLGSIVAIIFLSTVFPIIVNTMTGVRTIDRDFIKVARSFGATDRQFFLTVALPSSLPNLLTGLRLGIGHALIGIIVGEMYGAQSGIGYMMNIAGSTFQTDNVMVGLIVIAAAGMLLTHLLKVIERRFEAWRGTTQN